MTEGRISKDSVRFDGAQLSSAPKGFSVLLQRCTRPTLVCRGVMIRHGTPP